MRITKKRKGFTIVELVIVIAVIGILAAILIPTFVNLTNKANTVQAESFVKNINTNLAIREGQTGVKFDTPEDAVAAGIDAGFDVTKIKPGDGNEVVYDSAANRFALVKPAYETSRSMNDVVYSDGEIKGKGDQVYKIFASKPESTSYGIYAVGEWPAALTVTGNFDQGRSTGTTSVTVADSAAPAPLVYSGSFRTESKKSAAPARTIKVRTNSTGTEFIVNSTAEITHHGKAKSLDFQNAGSLVINGEYPFLEIGKGNVTIAAGAKVDVLYLNANANNQFDEIKITLEAGAELPNEIRLDSIGTDIGTDLVKVCTIETSASEEAKALANAKVGDEVEDTGATAEEKAETKEEAVAEAQTKEVEEKGEQSGSRFVARIGTKGYEKFTDAVKAAQEGEKIVVLSDFDIDSNIGTNSHDGLSNKVVFNKDTTIIFKNTAKVFMTDDGWFCLNGNTLNVVFDSSCDANEQSGFMNCSLHVAYSGLHEEYWDYVFDNNSAAIFVDFHGDSSLGAGIGLVYTSQQFIIGGASGIDDAAYDEASANNTWLNYELQPGSGGQWTNAIDEGQTARIYLASGAESYVWKAYAGYSGTTETEDIEIFENHGSWVVVKGVHNSSGGMNGAMTRISATVTMENGDVYAYEWWFPVTGGNIGPGTPPPFPIDF